MKNLKEYKLKYILPLTDLFPVEKARQPVKTVPCYFLRNESPLCHALWILLLHLNKKQNKQEQQNIYHVKFCSSLCPMKLEGAISFATFSKTSEINNEIERGFHTTNQIWILKIINTSSKIARQVLHPFQKSKWVSRWQK